MTIPTSLAALLAQKSAEAAHLYVIDVGCRSVYVAAASFDEARDALYELVDIVLDGQFELYRLIGVERVRMQ